MRKLSMDGTSPVEVKLGPDEKPLNKSERPQDGCQVELTQIWVGSVQWWSFSFEAFGEMLTVERSLRQGVAFMAQRKPVLPSDGFLASYPTWLPRSESEH